MNRYNNIPVYKTISGKRYYSTSTLPTIDRKLSDIYILSTRGDRLDLYADRYYGDSRLWFIIAQANNLGNGSLIVPPAIQVRIPMEIEEFLQKI